MINTTQRSCAFLVGALLLVLQFSQAQVEVKKLSTSNTPKDAWVALPKEMTPALEEVEGTVIYPVRVPVTGGPQRQPFDIMLRSVGKKTLPNSAPVAIYRVTPPMAQVVFDPQFSSDGETLMFKVGWPYEKFSTYHLYFWSIVQQKLLPSPRDSITNQKVAWSHGGRFIAYIIGGDYEGGVWDDKDSLRLLVYDRQTGQSRIVASNPGVTSFTWTPTDTLLFLSFSDESITQSREAITKHGHQPALSQHPQIMEVSGLTGEPKVIANDAYGNLYYSVMPPFAASPDGKWIAFYGWPENKTKPVYKTKNSENIKAEEAGLYLLDSKSNKRFLVQHYSAHAQDFLTWTPDSKHLVLTRTTYDSDGNQGVGKAKITLVDTHQVEAKEITTLRTVDYQFIHRRSSEPQFEPVRISQDSRFLLIKSWQAKTPQSGIDRRMTYPVLNSLRSVDLVTGTVRMICQTISRQSSSHGLSWIETVAKQNQQSVEIPKS